MVLFLIKNFFFLYISILIKLIFKNKRMNFLLKKIQLKKKRKKIFSLIKLNFINIAQFNFHFIYFLNLKTEEKFFFGINLYTFKNEKLYIYNQKDLSCISFFIYNPFIFLVSSF